MKQFEGPDELLVVAAILGNLEAFEQLVVRYQACRGETREDDRGDGYAEDVAQESLLLAFKALPSHRGAREVCGVAVGDYATSGAAV